MTRYRTGGARPHPPYPALPTTQQRIRQYLRTHSDMLALAVITLLLGLLPLLFWTGVTTKSMNLGGDNGLLYFAYPLQWLSHTSLTAVSENLAGYDPSPQYLPLCLLLLPFSIAGINAEGVFLGMVLAALFLGTVKVAFLVLQLAFPDRDIAQLRAPSFLAGIIVVAAPLLAQTQWTYILPGLWWDALLPWLVVAYLRHQATGGLRFALAAALLSSLLASAIIDVPISIGAALAALFLVASLHLSGLSRFKPTQALTFAAVVVATSAFWAVPFAGSFVIGQLQTQSALSANSKEATIAIIRTLSPLQSPIAALEMRLGTKFMLAFRLPLLAPNNWYRIVGLVGTLPCLLSVLGVGIGIRIAGKSRSVVLLVLLAMATCVTLMLLAPELAPGEAVMLFLTHAVPGWTATQDFYNVFALPFVFLLALTTSVSLCTLSASRLHFLAARPAVLLVSAALLVYSAPFLGGTYFRLPYQLTGGYNRVVPGLPTDYVGLLARLRSLPPGPVLSLPLSAPAWTVIPSPRVPKHVEGVYIGISPVYFLTGRSDYNGVASFANDVVASLPNDIQSALAAQNTGAFVAIARALGIRYVILNTAAALARADYYGVGAVGNALTQKTETSAIARALAPMVLAREGSYQLRLVTDAVPFPVRVLPTAQMATSRDFFLRTALGLPTAMLGTCPTWSVAAQSSSPWQVTVRLRTPRGTTPGECTLVLEYPHSALWTATLDSQGRPALSPVSRPVLGLFTGFKLPTGAARPLTVVIQYRGQLFVTAGFGVSLLAWVWLMVAGGIGLWPGGRPPRASASVGVHQEGI